MAQSTYFTNYSIKEVGKMVNEKQIGQRWADDKVSGGLEGMLFPIFLVLII